MNKYKFLIGTLSLFIIMIISMLLLAYPDYVLNTMYYSIGISLFIVSFACLIYFVVRLKNKEKFKYYLLALGFIGILIAALIILKRDFLASFLNVVVGLVIIAVSILSLQISLALKKQNKNYITTLFITTANIILGLALIPTVFKETLLKTELIAIILFITSLLNIVLLLTYKINHEE